MENLIYLNVRSVNHHLPLLRIIKKTHFNDWLNLVSFSSWPSNQQSRVHKLKTPWNMASTVSPIPTITNNELNFGFVMDEIGTRECQKIVSNNKIPLMCWSGGIDSTSILVSILKNATQEFLQRLIILMDNNSIRENMFFYSKYIKNKIHTQDINNFFVTPENYNKIVILDGECGNQCMGWRTIQILSYLEKFEVLNSRYKTHSHLINNFFTDFNVDYNINQFLKSQKIDPKHFSHIKKYFNNTENRIRELIDESLEYSPVPIETNYDYIWWANFNFKWDDVLLRKINIWTRNLTPEQSKYFWENSLCRFYQDDIMQMWSMNSKDIRREKTVTFSKYYTKKYIFDFDGNDLYFENKRESYSSTNQYEDLNAGRDNIFAVDRDWNKYDIQNKETLKIFLSKLE